MKLNRDKLIEIVQSAITACDEKQVEWDRNVEAAEKEWERRWREHQVAQWRPFRDKLTKALKDGSHVTVDDLPIKVPRYSGDPVDGPLYRPFNRGSYKYGYHKRPEDWFADHRFGPRPVTEKSTFETVLLFLETVEEETLTTGQLQSVGFRNLEKLISAAGAAGTWNNKVA